jgi:hypothetical protein
MLAKDYLTDNLGSNSEYILKLRGSERIKIGKGKRVRSESLS